MYFKNLFSSLFNEVNGKQYALNNAQFSKKDRLEMIYMRSFLDKIEKDFQVKDSETKRIRFELFNAFGF